MDLRHLRTFVAVAELGTVSKAALHLRTAQPALSRQISDLEQELGLTLFDRVGRRLFLTGAGEQLLGSCRSLLGSVSALGEQAQLLRHGDTGVLKVAASPGADRNGFFDVPAPICETLSGRAGEIDRGNRHRHAGACSNAAKSISASVCFNPFRPTIVTSESIRCRRWSSWPPATRHFRLRAAARSTSAGSPRTRYFCSIPVSWSARRLTRSAVLRG